MKSTRFQKYAWGVLGFNILVILWGAYVRATGSGAGCGSHWPLCNGEVIPRAPQIETVIEFTHRLTSGAALLLVIGLWLWARGAYPAVHRVRKGARFSLIFILTEALIGAGLVLFQWVGLNDSVERAAAMAVHLVNTFLLLACLTLTAWWAAGGAPVRLSLEDAWTWIFALGFGFILVIGVTGAITALGDTLYPSGSLAEGVQRDFSATAHFLERLRVWHPVSAVFSSIYLVIVAIWLALARPESMVRRLAYALSALILAQSIAGVINLALLAPVAMQIIHLLLADLVWIMLVLFAAVVFSRHAQLAEEKSHRQAVESIAQEFSRQ